MLHILNGDSAANSLRESGLAGEILAFREALMEGPTPRGLLSADEWFSTRAAFLSNGYEPDVEACRTSLLRQYEAMGRFRDHDVVTVWVGPDLFCQVTMIYLLSWFEQQQRGTTRLSLVCVNEVPGIADFRCLGQLEPAQLASLFDQRQEVTALHLGLASKAWQAYSSPDPQAIEALLGEETSPLPYLRDAMLLHLARFPSVRNGVGAIGNRALKLISEGQTTFKELFPEFGKAEPAYGLGDTQFWSDLKLMGQTREPLLIIEGVAELNRTSFGNGFINATFELTETGAAVLAGTSDFIETNGVDRWLGGVHLTDSGCWRWDEQNQKLTAPAQG
jgi:hypothetical protein